MLIFSSVKINEKAYQILRIASSGMLRHVALVRTDVSDEHSASFIRVTRIGELGTTLAVTSNQRTLRRNTKSHSRHNIPEDAILHSHHREHLKSYLSNIANCNHI
jgi:hypothetical protein